MKLHAQRVGALALALSLIVAPVLTTTADAGQRHRRESRGRSSSSSHREYRTRHEAPRHRDHDRGRRGHHRGRHHDSAFWPFVGGVVVGAVIGSQCDAPPVRCETPRPVARARIFYYDCGACDYRGVGYEAFCDHHVYAHHVPRCDVTRWYRPYEHGSWEDDD